MKTFRPSIVFAVAAVLLAGCDGSVAGPAAEDAAPRRVLCVESSECGRQWPDDPNPPPPPPPAAKFSYGSYISTLLGTVNKQVDLQSYSKADGNVAQTTVDASFRYASVCGLTPLEYDHQSYSASGSPAYLLARSINQYPKANVHRWQVVATHSFTPVPGATGGGTFNSGHTVCF